MDRLAEEYPGPTAQGGARPRRSPCGASPWVVPLVAMVVAVVVWAVGRTTGVPLEVAAGAGTRTVGVVDVAVAALVAGLAGWGVRALIRRLTGGGDRAWLVLCVVVLAVSLLGPLGAATPAAAGLLVAEHVAVGSAIALGLSDRRCGRRGTPAGRGA